MPRPPRPLTDAQRRVLDFIREFQEQNGFAPSQVEIARGLGFRSANAAAEHLRAIIRKGALERVAGVARGLVIPAAAGPKRKGRPAVGAEPSPTGLPLVGRVAAGSPILAQESIERIVPISPSFFRPRADYLLRVQGDSMIEADIRPGDLVAVCRGENIENGQIAVVRFGDQVTLKRWRRRGRKILLEPANARLETRIYDPAETEMSLEGRVVGLVRLGAETGLSS